MEVQPPSQKTHVQEHGSLWFGKTILKTTPFHFFHCSQTLQAHHLEMKKEYVCIRQNVIGDEGFKFCGSNHFFAEIS